MEETIVSGGEVLYRYQAIAFFSGVQAEQGSSHATSVSSLWGRRVHRAGRHRVSAYYPPVAPQSGGALEFRDVCRIVLRCVVFVVLRVLGIVGEILWSVVSSSYERPSVESRVLDGLQRRRHCCGCRVMAVSLYFTEKRVVLRLGV